MTTYSGKDYWNAHPTKWPTVPLRKVARLGTGHTPSRSVAEYWENCTIPWLTTEDLTSRRGLGPLEPVMETRQLISELGLANSAAELHPADTVMLSRTASVGHVARVGTPMATTQAFVTWTCSKALDPRYLTAVLLAMNPEFFRLAYGSTHLTIYMPDIEQLHVPFPPLSEQRAIADYLDGETARVDAMIAKKQRLLHLLEERFLARIDDECSGEDVVLRRVIARFVDYRGATPNKSDHGVPLLTATHIKGGTVDHSLEPVFVSEATYGSWMRRGFPSRGDVLVTMEAPLGEVAQISEARVALAQRLVLLKTDANRCTPDYLAFALRSTRMQHRLRAYATGSTALGIKADRLKGLLVPVPSLTRQAEAVAALRCEEGAKMQVARLLSHQLNLLAEHRQAIITAAITGEFQVPGAA